MKSITNLLRAAVSDKGDTSAMRVMSLVSLLCGCVIGIYGVIRGTDLVGVAAVCSVFIGAAFAGKAAQKFGE